MSVGQDDFQELRKLLALKRHEQPPPGYFNNFSRNVIAGIRAADSAAHAPRPNWFQRFWATLESQPVAAGAFGATVCAVLLAGFVYSGSTLDTTPAGFTDAGFAPGAMEASAITYSPSPALEPFQNMVGTNGFLPLPGVSRSLFTELPNQPVAQPVNAFGPPLR